jgi:hypothetical protein
MSTESEPVVLVIFPEPRTPYEPQTYRMMVWAPGPRRIPRNTGPSFHSLLEARAAAVGALAVSGRGSYVVEQEEGSK